MQIKSDLSTLIAAGTLLVAGAVGWVTLSNKVDKVGDLVAELKRGKADRECLAILDRQATAEDRNRLAIVRVLSSLAEQRGCFDPPGSEMMATADANLVGMATAAADAGYDMESAAAVGDYTALLPKSGANVVVPFWEAIERVDRQLAEPVDSDPRP